MLQPPLSLGLAAGVNDLISFRAQVNFITVDNGQVPVYPCMCVCVSEPVCG